MNNASKSQVAFLILLLTSEIALISATKPLWFAVGAFPAVPLLSFLKDVPQEFGVWLSVGLIGCCVSGIVKSARILRTSIMPSEKLAAEPYSPSSLIPLVASIVFGGLLVLCNQHRLQPWHWLFLLLLTQAVTLNGAEQVRTQRLTVASIYVFAALSRIGPGIDSGMSLQVLTTLLKLSGLTHLANVPEATFVGCCAMSVFEGVVGVGLLFAKTRRIAVVAAVLIHGVLLLALGSWGLNHNAGVSLWNLFLMLGVPILFWETLSLNSSGSPNSRNSRWRLYIAECSFVVLFPIAGLFGFFDNWPGWQLYSPRPDVVRLFVSADVASTLPSECRPFVGEPPPLQELCPVRLDRWSLAATGAPLYPEDRFQLTVIRHLLGPQPPEDVRVVVDTASFPDYWNRQQVER